MAEAAANSSSDENAEEMVFDEDDIMIFGESLPYQFELRYTPEEFAIRMENLRTQNLRHDMPVSTPVS